MKRTAQYLAVCVGITIFAGVLLSLIFPGAAARPAILWSAAIALVVQACAFALSRRMRGGDFLIGLAGGALIRFVAVIAYAVVVATVAPLPATAALISLVVFLFLMMLAEPMLARA